MGFDLPDEIFPAKRWISLAALLQICLAKENCIPINVPSRYSNFGLAHLPLNEVTNVRFLHNTQSKASVFSGP